MNDYEAVRELQRLDERRCPSIEACAAVNVCVDCCFTIQPGEETVDVPYMPATAKVAELNPMSSVRYAKRCGDCERVAQQKRLRATG